MTQRTDFNEAFDAPAPATDGSELALHLDPMMLFALVVVGVLFALLGYAAYDFGRRHGRDAMRRAQEVSARSIYESIRYYLDKALAAPGALIVERARTLADTVDSRLGFVLALDARYAKMIGALKTALAGPVEVKPAEPPKPKVPMGTEEQRLAVWKALQDFNTVWSDKPAIMAMIAAAQDELTHIPAPPRPMKAAATAAATSEAPAAKASKASSGKSAKSGARPKPHDLDAIQRAAASSVPAARPADAAAPVTLASDPVGAAPVDPRPTTKGPKRIPRHKKNMLA